MRFFSFSLYTLFLSLWVGGMFLFTFVVTPLIFKSYSRDAAGQIVGNLMPLYFSYNLVLSAGALALLFFVAKDHSQMLFRVCLLLAGLALAVNLLVRYKLYPDTVRVKQEVASFEREPDSAARKKFTQLHAVSAVLNLLVLADGAALLILAPLLHKR